MIRSSIDLGTNTALLLLVEWDSKTQKIHQILEDCSTSVRLGEGVDQNREFGPQAMQRTMVCLQDYAKKVRQKGGRVEETLCVATSQARDAKNSHEFFEQIKQEIGFSFRVISGKEEARYTFYGSLALAQDAAQSYVIDIGGGSTEVISVNQSQSLDMGSVRFTERYFKSDPVTDEEFWRCQEAIDSELESVLPWAKGIHPEVNLIAVAGTATTLAACYLGLKKFDPDLVDGVILTRGDVHRLVEELKWRKVCERKEILGIEAARADVILSGSLILWRVLEVLGFEACQISVRGLRYGLLM